jgi:hypothetical protein
MSVRILHCIVSYINFIYRKFVRSKTVHSHVQSVSAPPLYAHSKLDTITSCVPQCALLYTISNSNITVHYQ